MAPDASSVEPKTLPAIFSVARARPTGDRSFHDQDRQGPCACRPLRRRRGRDTSRMGSEPISTRHRFAPRRGRPRRDPRRLQGVRGGQQGAPGADPRGGGRGLRSSPGSSPATRASRIGWVGRRPMPASSTPATPPIRRAPSSTATPRKSSPRRPRISCSSRWSSTASTMGPLDAALGDPALAHWKPWLDDMRREKPYQLEDRVEQLFHEKSVTGRRRLEPAVRRDHRRAALHGRTDRS